MSNMSPLAHFPLEPTCEDFTFWDHISKEFEYVQYTILTDSVKTTELYASFGPNAITSSLSLGFLCSVRNLSHNSFPSLLLASSLMN